MRKARVWGLTALAVGGAASVAFMLNAGSAHDQPKAVAEAQGVPERPDWNWDVRPILSQNCFYCHGKGAQKAGLRLDMENSAKGELPEDKGKRAIVAGNPNKSELYKRIVSTDVDYMMPTKESHKVLSPTDIATIERWIKQGAKFEQHWAYIPAKEVKPEGSPWDKRAVNQIDKYVFARLKKEGLTPAEDADRETLINRVTLDLTGLPPTLAQVDAFVNDKDPKAYEKVVDGLLSSRAYAERQANVWLDVARYADTNGGLFDRNSSIQFPYRDWVITAFQRNIPYDKFLTWQLAGDQLPKASTEQVLATSFLRVGMKDSEAGSIDEEYRTNFMNERTELVGKAFLGLTVGCAKCHDHKYDVITQADYYSLGGFFNQIDENGLNPGGGPTLAWPTPTQAKNQAAAQKVVQSKWAIYQATLNAARARGANQVAAIPASQRGAYLQGSITAATEDYYPFDSGYKTGAKGEFASLEEDPGPLRIGAPDPMAPPKKMAMTRAQFQTSLQNKIFAEAQDRLANPEKYVAADKAKAEAAAAKAATLAHAGRPGMGAMGGKPEKVAMTGHKGPGLGAAGPGHKPGLTRVMAYSDVGVGKPNGPLGKPAGPGGKPGAKGPGRVFAPGGEAGAGAGDDDDGPRPVASGPRDPDAPRIAAGEINRALKQLADAGFEDDRISDPQRAEKRDLPVELKAERLQWTASGIPGGQPAAADNVKFIPGAKGQGMLLHDSVAFVPKGMGNFERTQPRTLDFWIKLRGKDYVVDTSPQGPEAVILGNTGQVNGRGYQLTLNKGKLEYAIIHAYPDNQIKVSGTQQLPRNRWIHLTATYDGNSDASGMKLFLDGQPMPTTVLLNHLTGSARAGGRSSLFGGYYGLSMGHGFNKPELTDSGFDELKIMTRALTPLEVAYNHNQAALASAKADDVKTQLVEVAVSKDPLVAKAWADLTEARLAQQKVEAAIPQLLVAGDLPTPRTNYILDRGVFNTYRGEVQAQAPSGVMAWSSKLPRNRLGLADWLFDAKNPLTARVYVNRMWQGHFGNGIVTSVDDFGTQGSNPTNPQLLDYLAVEFQRSGWDMKHMHKLMVMSDAYRQSSVVSQDKLEKDPRNLLVDRGPRFRMTAEMIRDTSLFVSGLLVDKPGGDSVFPYQPDLIWDGAAQGFVVYPYSVAKDEEYRRSMYTFIKRNQAPANMVVFDMPDRKSATVLRPMSSSPLQALVLLNDPQFLETYRKLAERVIKSSPDQNQQLVTLFRLAARRHPTDRELTAMRSYRQAEAARAAASPDEVSKLLSIGRAPTDASIDRVQLTAMTVVAAGVMNSPDAYTLR